MGDGVLVIPHRQRVPQGSSCRPLSWSHARTRHGRTPKLPKELRIPDLAWIRCGFLRFVLVGCDLALAGCYSQIGGCGVKGQWRKVGRASLGLLRASSPRVHRVVCINKYSALQGITIRESLPASLNLHSTSFRALANMPATLGKHRQLSHLVQTNTRNQSAYFGADSGPRLCQGWALS